MRKMTLSWALCKLKARGSLEYFVRHPRKHLRVPWQNKTTRASHRAPARVPSQLKFEDSLKLLKISCNTPHVKMQSPTTGISFQHLNLLLFPLLVRILEETLNSNDLAAKTVPSGGQALKFLQKIQKHYKRFWPHISQGSRVAALIQDLPTRPLTTMMLTWFLFFVFFKAGRNWSFLIWSRSFSGLCKIKLLFLYSWYMWLYILCYWLKDVKVGQETEDWNLKLEASR